MKTKNKQTKQSQPVASRVVTKSAPVAKGTVAKGARAPNVKFSSDGACTISHMEYVTDLNTSAATVASRYPVNPQLASVFTWLSAIAARFEMYRFKKLKFHFKTSAATTTQGYTAFGFDFDATDPSPTKGVMLTWKHSAKGAIWTDFCLDVSDDSRMSTWRYCNYSTPLGSDVRLDNIGTFYTLIQGPVVPLPQFIGELFVEYICEFRQPSYRLPPVYSASLSSTGWTATNAFFGSTGSLSQSGNLPYFLTTRNIMQFQAAGQYLITSIVNGSGITSPITLSANFDSSYPSASWALGSLASTNDSVSAQAQHYLDVFVPGVDVSFNVSGSAIASSLVRVATYLLQN